MLEWRLKALPQLASKMSEPALAQREVRADRLPGRSAYYAAPKKLPKLDSLEQGSDPKLVADL